MYLKLKQEDGVRIAAGMVARERSFQGGERTTVEVGVGEDLAEVGKRTRVEVGVGKDLVEVR